MWLRIAQVSFGMGMAVFFLTTLDYLIMPSRDLKERVVCFFAGIGFMIMGMGIHLILV